MRAITGIAPASVNVGPADERPPESTAVRSQSQVRMSVVDKDANERLRRHGGIPGTGSPQRVNPLWARQKRQRRRRVIGTQTTEVNIKCQRVGISAGQRECAHPATRRWHSSGKPFRSSPMTCH